MPGYTLKNLQDDVEDMAPRFGMAPPLEAHFAREALGCEKSAVSLLRLDPDGRVPFGHHHGEQEEVYVVVEGGGRIKLDDDVLDLRAWDAVRIAPETVRQVEAGPGGLAILAFGAPNTGMGDAQMIQGWWTG